MAPAGTGDEPIVGTNRGSSGDTDLVWFGECSKLVDTCMGIESILEWE